MPRTLTLALAAVLTALLALPLAASASHPYDESKARYNQEVGFSDQSARIFDAPVFQRLAIRRTRLIVPWNVMDNPQELQKATQYVQRSRANGDLVLLHLGDETPGNAVDNNPLPSRRRFEKAMDGLVPYFHGLGVREFGVWNEANHTSQPTDRRPDRAAEYFMEAYRAVHLKSGIGCKYPRCRIVALDALDEDGSERYIRGFYRRLNNTYDNRAETVGIHNYSAVNRFSNRQVAEMISAFRRENRGIDIWATEVGGLVAFGSGRYACNPNSRASIANAEERQDRAIRFMFRQMRTFNRFLDRLYFYNFFGNDCRYEGQRPAGRSRPGDPFNVFDAGLVKSDGEPRDGFYEFQRRARDFRR